MDWISNRIYEIAVYPIAQPIRQKLVYEKKSLLRRQMSVVPHMPESQMAKLTITSQSEQQTTELGQRLGRSVEPGTVIGLNGTLGSGKTRLTQGIGQGLDIAEGAIVSPTYTLCVPHEGRLGLLHLDAYRIADPSEVDELGLDELTENGVVLIVEWSKRIETLLPPIDLDVTIEPTGEHIRQFEFQSLSSLGQRLLEQLRL